MPKKIAEGVIAILNAIDVEQPKWRNNQSLHTHVNLLHIQYADPRSPKNRGIVQWCGNVFPNGITVGGGVMARQGRGSRKSGTVVCGCKRASSHEKGRYEQWATVWALLLVNSHEVFTCSLTTLPSIDP